MCDERQWVGKTPGRKQKGGKWLASKRLWEKTGYRLEHNTRNGFRFRKSYMDGWNAEDIYNGFAFEDKFTIHL